MTIIGSSIKLLDDFDKQQSGEQCISWQAVPDMFWRAKAGSCLVPSDSSTQNAPDVEGPFKDSSCTEYYNGYTSDLAGNDPDACYNFPPPKPNVAGFWDLIFSGPIKGVQVQCAGVQDSVVLEHICRIPPPPPPSMPPLPSPPP
eukprot:CAMPEP_0119094900 /NCGR_PEP_ID=MMETSP1178-20130426/167821_1 /TAXON_ID=33656 /ORGANISM="unid sp, Strain CCMP2000" /LENGTH=143 /DNA_ID=CAMNT_0007078673 /DNA_START=198 /DNA_END=624 /DNA_ORIENTATION=+